MGEQAGRPIAAAPVCRYKHLERFGSVEARNMTRVADALGYASEVVTRVDGRAESRGFAG
jgi:hypothetical protein